MYAFTTRDGTGRTAKEIEQAFAACRVLELAYAKADPDNGGGSSIDWDTLALARDRAIEALSAKELEVIEGQARDDNGVGD